MLWIEQKYLNLVSSHLPLYKVKSYNPFLAEARCYVCGDSKKNALKKRAFFFVQKDHILMKCHNCGCVRSVKSILKENDQNLFHEYNMELLQETYNNKPIAAPEENIPKYLTEDPKGSLETIQKISELDPDHPARSYLSSRLLPEIAFDRLYYTDTFFAWTNTIVPNKFTPNKDTGAFRDEPRIVIPFIDPEGGLFGFQGRALPDSTGSRYIAIMAKGRFVKAFGLDVTDFDKHVYVTEGPFDSLFLPNAVAMGGADVDMKILNKDTTTIVLDNEPRNREMVRRYEKLIEQDWSVCIWPTDLEYKDINDMILAGMTVDEIKELIDNNTFRGLEAKLVLSSWTRI